MIPYLNCLSTTAQWPIAICVITNKIAMEELLPKLEPQITLPHETRQSFAKTKSYHYYKALHDLKEVTHQLAALNHRIGILTAKETQATHPIAHYYEDRTRKLRSQIQQSNKKSQQDLLRIYEKEQQLLGKRIVKNEETKRENLRRKEKAKRVIAQQKYKSHDCVRQNSLQNEKVIQHAKIHSLHKKKEQYCQVVRFQKQSRTHIRQLSLSRISSIVESRQAETNKILNKLKQKERMLAEKKEQCFVKEASLERLMGQRKKPPRARPRRLFTEETKSTVLFGTDASVSPKSALSFVIIP